MAHILNPRGREWVELPNGRVVHGRRAREVLLGGIKHRARGVEQWDGSGDVTVCAPAVNLKARTVMEQVDDDTRERMRDIEARLRWFRRTGRPDGFWQKVRRHGPR